MNIVFIDPKCPKSYDSEVLATRGLGGTEATVLRIAQALSRTHTVTVLQHNRHAVLSESPSLRFAPATDWQAIVPHADHVIFIQKAQNLSAIAAASRGRLWVWLHNFLGEEVPFFWQDHLRHRLGMICVSRMHALHSLAYLRSRPLHWLTLGLATRGGMLFHHNPIAQTLRPDISVKRDPNKLVFFSSPYKGIEHVLARFDEVYQLNSNLRLYVADPGYIRNFDESRLAHPGIVRLGSLPQTEVLQHVREALCVFYPQYKRPETFGLVFAEANAVGTPVLAHDFGAAREILAANNPPFDTRDSQQVAKQLMAWSAGDAPAIEPDGRFSLEHIAAGWEQFLTAPDAYAKNLGLTQ